MTSEMRMATREEGLAQGRGTNGSELVALQQHIQQIKLRLGDLGIQIGQLQEQKDLAAPRDKARFNQQIADLKHEETVLTLDYDATQGAIALAKVQQPVATTIQPLRMPRITRREAEWAGVGTFLLLMPLVIALARRIWVRGGQRVQPFVDLESSPRMERLEQAVEAIAIEVERVGEGQRFSTKLLSERLADPAAKRGTPESPGARRPPGVITPH